jgi:glycosyltransferase involved in cell wall biosynthesis
MNGVAGIGKTTTVSEIGQKKFGVDGFLFEPGNVADLVEKLKQVLRLSVVQRNQMGLAGRKRVLSYDWEHHIDVISDLYTRIIKNGNS